MKEATYRLLGGGSVTIPYDETAPCRMCHQPVIEASVGGTDVCPWCDMGIPRYDPTEVPKCFSKMKEEA